MRTMVRVRETFCAALELKDPKLTEEENLKRYGRWTETHGHDFTVEVVVAGPVNRRTGCIAEYSSLRRRLRREIINPLDHKMLNDAEMLKDVAPTAENMVRIFFRRFARSLPKRVQLVSLTIEDGQGNASIATAD